MSQESKNISGMPVDSNSQLSIALCKAIGLPDLAIWANLRIETRGVITVQCEYYIDEEQMKKGISVMQEYQLEAVPIPK